MADTGLLATGYEAPRRSAGRKARGEAVETRTVTRTWLDRYSKRRSWLSWRCSVSPLLASTASRYVLNASVIWSKRYRFSSRSGSRSSEASSHFAGGDHVSVDALQRLLPHAGRRSAELFVDFLSFGLLPCSGA